ncbi:hypothetical protein P153DRAFT_282099 [Dothidotthia symphoricarpi CBS 119687]|uniref:F-box domain-containing protein n=1 Tax=Dothidotthia symphoricarpi CBS 119687 TaxID=1392245 RepID=A0A6A6AQI6_9PLEO|nr:uncharacterized protein P153DRAFT_282099 [Dothidotthia symphoricarpi CBS 119687]KAF2133117.1 hypothetical protein P153DRAFT_282099 [Dothidotthia symphoricarpi CBS 119687]
MNTFGYTAPIFALPLELREQIYRDVLSSTEQGSDLLRTCRDIYTEAQKFLYQRNINFCGQSALFQWLDHVPAEFLSYVTQISLSVLDVDLSPLLKSKFEAYRSISPTRLHTWELYNREVERLRAALEKLPRIQAITIRALPGQRSYFYQEFLSKVLGMLSSLHSNLLDLRLGGNLNHQNLSFLSKLRRLQSFSFNGISSSSPMEMAGILASLDHLTHLSLVSQHGISECLLHHVSTTKQRSSSPDVIRTMEQLAPFFGTDRISASSPALAFTPEVLGAIHDHKTLNGLSISLSQTPDLQTLGSLEEYLGKASIEELELNWPDLDPDVLKQFDLLPESLKHLCVRSRSNADASAMLCSIVDFQKAGGLLQLRTVVLVRSAQSCKNSPSGRKDNEIGEAEVGDDVVSFQVHGEWKG